MTEQAIQRSFPTTTNNTGGCPVCGNSEDTCDIGSSSWGSCDVHKFKWLIRGSNCSSRQEGDETVWQENTDRLARHVEVEPMRCNNDEIFDIPVALGNWRTWLAHPFGSNLYELGSEASVHFSREQLVQLLKDLEAANNLLSQELYDKYYPVPSWQSELSCKQDDDEHDEIPFEAPR